MMSAVEAERRFAGKIEFANPTRLGGLIREYSFAA
jgi:hypothetical protein